ncbi:MAG: AsmA-like C-terminal domain-containing protein, partial [Rhizomicrobium sp.]
VDKVLLRNCVVVNGLDVDFATNGSRLASLHLAGTMGKSTLQGSLSQNVAGRNVTVRVDDAGQLLKGLYGIAGLRGGKIDMAAFFPGRSTDPPSHDSNAPDFKGKLVMKDFIAVDQPFLARLFTAGSLGGMVNLMQGEGIAVDMLEMPFASRNNVISIQGMRAVGPAVGLTGEGYIDRPQGLIALKGTLVPLYGLNSVLGVIPLLGDVLTSKKGEGIFGMSYTVRGNVEEPSISVNPLSVLAPGILRRLFEGRPLNALQAPSNNPQKTPPAKKAVR